MQGRQKQAIESYQRVQVFLVNRPPPESPGYTARKKVLDEVVTTLNEHVVSQLAGQRLAHAEVTRQRALRKVLREDRPCPSVRYMFDASTMGRRYPPSRPCSVP